MKEAVTMTTPDERQIENLLIASEILRMELDDYRFVCLHRLL